MRKFLIMLGVVILGLFVLAIAVDSAAVNAAPSGSTPSPTVTCEQGPIITQPLCRPQGPGPCSLNPNLCKPAVIGAYPPHLPSSGSVILPAAVPTPTFHESGGSQGLANTGTRDTGFLTVLGIALLLSGTLITFGFRRRAH